MDVAMMEMTGEGDWCSVGPWLDELCLNWLMPKSKELETWLIFGRYSLREMIFAARRKPLTYSDA
jgi:hypothetical protein